MPDFGCETDLDNHKVELQPELRARGQTELFMRAAYAKVIVPGCTIEYSERNSEPHILTLRIIVKAPKTYPQIEISPRFMRE